MTRLITASAPGKVILFGEYAVLYGAPSLVLAVDRRVQIRLQLEASSNHDGLWLHCPGFLDEATVLTWVNQRLTHNDPSLQLLLRLINNLLAEVHVNTLQESAGLLTVDTRALFDEDRKLGLGSSAALNVALAGTLAQLDTGNLHVSTDTWQRLHHNHSEAQGKRGSGADVAASLLGGTVRFCNQKGARELAHCTLPKDLAMAFVWTGQSASTSQYLGSLSAWQNTHPELFQHHMNTLQHVSETAFNNLQDSEAFVTSLAEFTAALHAFASDSQLAVFAGGHQVLYELAIRYPELTYKPCGAGGGDLGVAVSPNPEALARYISEITQRGFATIDLHIDNLGLQSEQILSS